MKNSIKNRIAYYKEVLELHIAGKSGPGTCSYTADYCRYKIEFLTNAFSIFKKLQKKFAYCEALRLSGYDSVYIEIVKEKDDLYNDDINWDDIARIVRIADHQCNNFPRGIIVNYIF